jgi:hypothetical protein
VPKIKKGGRYLIRAGQADEWPMEIVEVGPDKVKASVIGDSGHKWKPVEFWRSDIHSIKPLEVSKMAAKAKMSKSDAEAATKMAGQEVLPGLVNNIKSKMKKDGGKAPAKRGRKPGRPFQPRTPDPAIAVKERAEIAADQAFSRVAGFVAQCGGMAAAKRELAAMEAWQNARSMNGAAE